MLPIFVKPPPPTVPGFTVTYSLNLLLSPISKNVFSPLYFKSCGSLPIELNGKKIFPFPIFVLPEIFTCEWTITFSFISTSGPMTVNGPIFTLE